MNKNCAAQVDRIAHDSLGGFTLLELLIAVSLLSLLFTILIGGIRFGSATWDASGKRDSQAADLQIVRDVLRRQLEQAFPLVSPQDKDKVIVFKGARDQLAFIGPPPSRSNSAGLYANAFAIQSSRDRQQLTFSWRKLKPDLSDLDSASGPELTVLVDRVEAARFSYFGSIDGVSATGWSDAWSASVTLPQLIRVDLAFRRGDKRVWVPLFVKPHIDANR